jgi:replicative DNA helicase
MATKPTQRRRTNGQHEPASSELLDRQRPRDLEAEQAVLGSILLLPTKLDEIETLLSSSDFYDEPNATLFAAMREINATGKQVDVKLLRDRLSKTKRGDSNEWEAIGGAAYVAQVAKSVPTAANVEHYAKIVRDAATQRAIIDSATTMLVDAYQPRLDVDASLSRAESLLWSVRDRRSAGVERIASAAAILATAFSEIESRRTGEIDGGLTTGFADVDSLLRLRGGHLTVLAGRPAMGKSALAVNVATYVALELELPVLFTTLEMPEVEIAIRMIAAEARIDARRLDHPEYLTDDDREKLATAVATLMPIPLVVDFSPGRSLADIASVARRQKRKSGLALLVVDYLQLVTPDDVRIPREQQVARLSAGFKRLARELDVPVLLLAQLNRQSEQNEAKRPRLSNLRESGAIEQDADSVLFVHRPEYYLLPDQVAASGMAGVAEIIVAKQRSGPTGDVRVAFNASQTRFDDLAHERHVREYRAEHGEF